MATLSQKLASRDATIDRSLPDDDANLSLIYAFLPPLFRRSVPKVRSLRRSIVNYRSFGSHSRRDSTDDLDSGIVTPPPAYHEALASLTSALIDDEDSFAEGSSTGALKGQTFSEDESSGIQWKYASQGKGD